MATINTTKYEVIHGGTAYALGKVKDVIVELNAKVDTAFKAAANVLNSKGVSLAGRVAIFTPTVILRLLQLAIHTTATTLAVLFLAGPVFFMHLGAKESLTVQMKDGDKEPVVEVKPKSEDDLLNAYISQDIDEDPYEDFIPADKTHKINELFEDLTDKDNASDSLFETPKPQIESNSSPDHAEYEMIFKKPVEEDEEVIPENDVFGILFNPEMPTDDVEMTDEDFIDNEDYDSSYNGYDSDSEHEADVARAIFNTNQPAYQPEIINQEDELGEIDKELAELEAELGPFNADENVDLDADTQEKIAKVENLKAEITQETDALTKRFKERQVLNLEAEIANARAQNKKINADTGQALQYLTDDKLAPRIRSPKSE